MSPWFPSVFAVILMASGSVGAREQSAEPPSCNMATATENRSLARAVAVNGDPSINAWSLFARRGRTDLSQQPPPRCNPDRSDCSAVGSIPTDSPPFELLVKGDRWSCIAPDGLGTLWVASENVAPLVVDPHPPLSAWIGRWEHGGWIEISSLDGRRLSIEGENTWHGLGDVVHYGTISFTAEAGSNPLKLADRGCEVSATLVGDYLMLHDNMGCGGMNVRFQGAWKRSIPQK
jgi:hypothetical protein